VEGVAECYGFDVSDLSSACSSLNLPFLLHLLFFLCAFFTFWSYGLKGKKEISHLFL
jgi:hypothetical protein